jgi:hypothetical protein
MSSNSQQILLSANKISKSKKKITPSPVYEISLLFSNNLLQTYLFEIFEKLKINLVPTEIKYGNTLIPNVLRINYNNEILFLILINKETLKEMTCLKNNYNKDFPILIQLEKILKITSNKCVTLLFLDIPNSYKFENFHLDEFIFFLNIEIGVKIVQTYGNNELVDFFANYVESLIKKESKSKITFFDSKPVTSTNLCDLEGITDEKTIMFVKHMMCIPGVSERKAISVVLTYPYLSNLMEIYLSSEFNEIEKENLLNDLEINDKSKNTVKKLGHVISSKIYRTFASTDPSIVIN